MSKTSEDSLMVPAHFIEATRDSGYKTLGSALAELIDNAFEAHATTVHITIENNREHTGREAVVTVSDNGRGMDAATCRNSLRFGWSTRFNQRTSHGRYGMGLPNASLSHARRLEIVTSPTGRFASSCWLDVDEIAEGHRDTVPDAIRVPISTFRSLHPFRRGTTITWKKCDRLEDRYLGPLRKRLRSELGRLFRYQIWAGKRILVDREKILPFDPLFERTSAGPTGAKAFGPELEFEVNCLRRDRPQATSIVCVRFTELPIASWHSMSNAYKNSGGIAKGAGVSIVRAGREIDRGWYFMGGKRRENYDDWWRCEVRFEPELDELFGVTHTKQEIHPTAELVGILTPDMEKVARELNARARDAFVQVKSETSRKTSEAMAERYDSLIEPPIQGRPHDTPARTPLLRRGGRGRISGLEYRLQLVHTSEAWLFQPTLNGARLVIRVNGQHPFLRRFGLGTTVGGRTEKALIATDIELLILAAGRAEVALSENKLAKAWLRRFRESWSNTLTTFLS